MGKLVNIEDPSSRVFRAIREVSLDAIRDAIQGAEKDLGSLEAIQLLSPYYQFHDGSTVNSRIAEKKLRIQELKHDLRGDRR